MEQIAPKTCNWRRENRVGITFKEIRARDGPKLRTDMKPKVQVQRRPSRIKREEIEKEHTKMYNT